MDDFQLGSIPAIDSSRDQKTADPRQRRKSPSAFPAALPDDIVELHQDCGYSDDAALDYFQPSDPAAHD